jgi:malonate transporter and related proteins
MTVALNALLPVLIVIVVGWAAANIPIIPREQWAGLDTLMYYILFPSLLVVSLIATDLTTLPFTTLGLALILSILTMAALCLLLRPLLASRCGVDGPGFTSIFQGATRWNTTVAIVIAGFAYGAEGVALMSVAIVAMIPLLNVLCVAVLAWFAAAATPSPKRIAIEIAKNPLIVACALGIALNLAEIVPPEGITSALRLLGNASLACALLAVGAGLDLHSLRRPGIRLGLATALRLVVMPLLAAGFATLIGVTDTARGIAIIAAAVPTAGASYALARKLGGDAKLMAEIVTLQTLLAVITLPLFLWLLA